MWWDVMWWLHCHSYLSHPDLKLRHCGRLAVTEVWLSGRPRRRGPSLTLPPCEAGGAVWAGTDRHLACAGPVPVDGARDLGRAVGGRGQVGWGVEYHVEGGLDWSGNWKKRSDGSVKKNQFANWRHIMPIFNPAAKKRWKQCVFLSHLIIEITINIAINVVVSDIYARKHRQRHMGILFSKCLL